ncbi:MAG: nitroreductase family protein [Chloroflexi bacterium]|nr:nitroreductase family protein [Chloroflexota bacterium]
MPVEPSDLDVLLDVIRHRKNVRRFKPDPVPEEYVNAIIEAARLAPSGANSQPWEFVVIRDPERKKRISDIFIEARKKGDEIQPEFPPTSEATFRAKIAEAPLLLAIVADPRFMRAYPAYGHRDHIFWESLGIVMENIHLAATALGPGHLLGHHQHAQRGAHWRGAGSSGAAGSHRGVLAGIPHRRAPRQGPARPVQHDPLRAPGRRQGTHRRGDREANRHPPHGGHILRRTYRHSRLNRRRSPRPRAGAWGTQPTPIDLQSIPTFRLTHARHGARIALTLGHA